MKVAPSTGTVTSVSGTITIPGLDGGSATVTVNVVRILGLYAGTVKVSDPSAAIDTTAIVATTNLARTTINQVTGTAVGLNGVRPYTLSFTA